MRKDKISELQPSHIFEGFCIAYRRNHNNVLHPNSVLAYLLVAKLATAEIPNPTPTIEYFNVAMLQTYLFERQRTDDRSGIMQIFIAPPGVVIDT